MTTESYGLHALHPDEEATLAVLRPSARSLRLLPTHCINEQSELEGFAMSVDERALGEVLPVNHSMFMGHSLFECRMRGGGLINRDVVRLMGAGEEANSAALASLVRRIRDQSQGKEASFECAPDNADAVIGLQGAHTHVSRSLGRRAVDSVRWYAEAPSVSGLYHAMVRGFQKDTRQHKLFIGVSGGCPTCCDRFYNLMLDVGHEWTCREVAMSEEVWWLRKACQRARCMVARQIADEFGLEIATQRDVHGYDSWPIGVPTVDTTEFDLVHNEGAGVVTLYNAACDTTSIRNGVLCHMHPSEGYWLFKGSPRPSARGTSFGSMFGCADVCGVFPTRAPCYRPGFGSPSHVFGYDAPCVRRLDAPPRAKGTDGGTVHQCFDEAFMRNLEVMGWNRDHGVVELVPIAVCVA